MPKVSDLTEATSMADTDFIPAVVGGNSRKVQRGNFLARSSVRLQASVAAAGQTELGQTGIPSWANRVTALGSLLSTSGTDDILIQVGNGSYVLTGYLSSYQGFTGSVTGAVPHTGGFGIDVDANTNQQTIRIALERQAGNLWIASGFARRNGSSVGFLIGEISLGSALDRIRFTTVNGTDTFDGGAASFSWE